MAVLTTPRLILTPCVPADAADFMALERDPEVMRYLNGGYAVDHSLDHSNATFLMPRGTENYVWTARHRDAETGTNSFAGWFCLWQESNALAELGYRLPCVVWGQGLAAEGGRALVNYGFEAGLYETIFASTMVVNQASRRVMEKIGMTYIRTAFDEWPDPIAGSEHGEVKYGINKETWARQRSLAEK